jgi:type IV pilus assembly protein PilC
MAATFTYKVRDRQGRLVEGSLEADNGALVAEKLRQMGYVPIAIDRKSGQTFERELHIPFIGDRVGMRDVAVFSRQFATMVNAGLTLLRTLTILAEQTESKALAAIADDVRADVEKGASLSQALAKHPKAFSRLYVSMVRAGEAAGVLDLVLTQLADTIEKQVTLRRKIVSALAYPVVVFGLVITIVTAMLLFVVPMFTKLYKQLGGALPLPTRVLVNVSNAMTNWWWLVTGAEVIGFIALRRWIKTDAGRERFDAFKLRLPIVGGLVRKAALTRFSRTLSVLLRAGVPILESLEITADTVNNAVLAKAVKATQAGVKVGESVARPLADHSSFPPMLVQMMAVGEETGALDTMLDKVADFYEAEVEATVAGLTSLLEPLLIVVMGGCVGGMVVALYLPMFNIIKLIK